ncbi:MAG: phenylalanine--tRNA ligase subunit beta [Deltaproteobacteria bacterium]|nr:phenylalanine--tRNA ligase subunit beta [Candidatus Anaeroferrophillacea bacterium]
MNVSWNWLQEFVDLSGIDPAAAAHRLTMAGLEIAAIRPALDQNLLKVVSARITAMKPHPQADKLTLCTVSDGSETMQIVCGAKNMRAGDTVALAPVGTRLPGGMQIKKSKIRGIDSFGMLCSAAEMGFAEESAGILILPPELEPGQPVVRALNLDDTILEVELTPNRGDCLSIIGIARELAAIYDRPCNYPTPPISENGGSPTASFVTIEIAEPELCPRYVGRVATDITLEESPLWLRQRLHSAGVRAINNVVDITNVVMLETGQPLHAFDLDFIRDRQIIVRRAGSDRAFTTLDNVERQLDPETLMICDGRGPVAVAGIMGGINSEIKDHTTRVLIESAHFQPASIRRSSRLLGLSTESSYRFERGVDPEGAPRAADRAISLLQQLAGARAAPGGLDVHPRPWQPAAITIRTAYTNRLLGIGLDTADIGTALKRLHFEITEKTDDAVTCRAPSFRFDMEREADLIEEVARFHGYDNIPRTLPRMSSEHRQAPAASDRFHGRLRQLMQAQGLSEAINYSFMDPAALGQLRIAAADRRRSLVRLRNPLTEEMAVMRTSLVPGLLKNLADNYRLARRDIRLFELGTLFFARPDERLPEEEGRLAGIITGNRRPRHFSVDSGKVDFFDLKGIVETIGTDIRRTLGFSSADGIEPYHHPGRAAGIFLDDARIGALGQVHPDIADDLDIDQELYLFELLTAPLATRHQERPAFRQLGRYPSVIRDLAIVVDNGVAAQTLIDCITSGSPLITETVLFDVYTGDQVPAGCKSMAFHITFQDHNKTLTDKKVHAIIERLSSIIKQDFGGAIRAS